MTSALAQAAGPLGGIGLGVLLAAPRRQLRLCGLVALALACLLLVVYLAPHGHRPLLAAAAVAGLVAAAIGAWLLRRWPWLLPLAALACVPARIPLTLGSTQGNLLVPLYGVVAALALLLAWELVRSDCEQPPELGRLALPLAVFVAWTGVSLLWTQDLHDGAIQLLFFFFPFGVLTVGLSRLPWRREWFEWLWVALTAMAVIFSVVGFYQYATRDIFWNPKIIVGNAYATFYRVNSVFWDPSIYGRFLVVAILASLVLVVHGAGRRVALFATAAVVVSFAGLVFSFSQSSFVSLAVGVAIVAWFAWRKWTLALLGVAAAFVLVAALALPSARHHSLNSASGGRFKLVTNGLAIAAHHPLQGVGVGGFKKAYAKRTGLKGKEPKSAASHDTPVTVAAEEGGIGLLLFAWLLVTAFFIAFRGFAASFAGRLSLTLGAVLAAIGVHSLFYNAFFEDPVVWGVFGLAPIAAVALAREPASGRQRPAGAPRPAAVAAPQAGRSRAEAG